VTPVRHTQLFQLDIRRMTARIAELEQQNAELREAYAAWHAERRHHDCGACDALAAVLGKYKP
jgi:hypothetical protein